ncbi:MAG: FAD binding domain-containing protein [Anaerolineaceae bacterium]
MDQTIELLDRYKEAGRIIAGGTDLILELERGARKGVECLLDVSRLGGLDKIELDNDGMLHIGPLVTHNQLLADALTRKYAAPLVLACWQLGSPQIRNRATIAGNLITASPANDTITPLMALNASVGLRSKSGTRYVKLKDFYKGVRRTVLNTDEMMIDITFPGLISEQCAGYYKYGLRNGMAISVVNACAVLKMRGKIISEVTITLGSVAPTIVHAVTAENYLIGKKLTEDVIKESAQLASKDSQPIDDIRASAVFRKYLVAVCVSKALHDINNNKSEKALPDQPVLLASTKRMKEFSSEDKDDIQTTINGKQYHFTDCRGKTLLRLLREDAGLTGTKEGCAEGECGACTVFMDGKAVMSCMVPAGRAHQAEIITIEGLALGDKLNTVQQGFMEKGAVQCGYCTPGMIMSATKLLEEKPRPTKDEIHQALAGNLCRCTGYYQIIEAVESAIMR